MVYLPDRERVPVPIMGYLDLRCEDEPLVIEFKTGRNATHSEWGWTDHRVNTSSQPVVYWMAERQLYNRDVTVRYTVLSWGNDRVSMIEKETHPDMVRVDEFQDQAAAVWQAILNEDFPCLCGRCGDTK